MQRLSNTMTFAGFEARLLLRRWKLWALVLALLYSHAVVWFPLGVLHKQKAARVAGVFQTHLTGNGEIVAGKFFGTRLQPVR